MKSLLYFLFVASCTSLISQQEPNSSPTDSPDYWYQILNSSQDDYQK